MTKQSNKPTVTDTDLVLDYLISIGKKAVRGIENEKTRTTVMYTDIEQTLASLPERVDIVSVTREPRAIGQLGLQRFVYTLKWNEY